MICHEVWDYADAGVAMLDALAILCPDCNAVHHIGLTGLRGYGNEALAHMARMNGTTVAEADVAVTKAFTEWRSRSDQSWTVRVAASMIARFPELAALEGARGIPGEGSVRARARDAH